MKKLFPFIVVLFCILNIACSDTNNTIDNKKTKNDFYIKMFPGINDFGFVNIENDNLVYIYADELNTNVMFVRINEYDEITVNKNITNIINPNGYIHTLSLLYEWNNQVVLVYFRQPQKDLFSITFDYEGNLISQKTIETNHSITDLKLTKDGFFIYNLLFESNSGYSLNYTKYNFDGMLAESRNTFLGINDLIINDLFINDGYFYLTGNSEFELGLGFQKEFCYQFDSNGNKLNSIIWEKDSNPLKTVYNVLNNKIHRLNFSSNTNDIELFNPDGELLKTLTLDYYPYNFIYNSKEQFIYLSHSNSDKTLDFKILDSNFDGLFSNIQNSGETIIFNIYESENYYNVFGQTTAIRNGDFDLPENTGSFDNFIARFKKN